MLKAALEYLHQGWSVFPCEERGKQPLVKWGDFSRRLPTEREVRAWWTRWPNANIALACGTVSGVVVVDVDTYKGGSLSNTTRTELVSKTGRGGFHCFYRYPKGVKNIPNRANVRGLYMDVRADGGYVILPPSVNEKGNPYMWLVEGKPVAPPEWVLKGRQDKKEESGEKWLTNLIKHGTTPGRRNDDTARFAGYLAGKELPPDVAEAMAVKWISTQEAPLSVDEVHTTVRSVYRTKRNNNSDRGKNNKNENDRSDQFALINFADYMAKFGSNEPEWVVNDWLPDSTIAFVASPPGGYKTWLTFDLAVSVASGKPFLGCARVDKPGPVIIVQQEDYHGQIADRLGSITMAKYHRDQPKPNGVEFDISLPSGISLPIHIHPDRSLKFADSNIVNALEETIQQIKPRLIIIDPLYSTVSTDNYMTKGVEDMMHLKRMRDEYGCSFLLVHHVKKSAEDWDRQNMWGSQFLNAFLETGWQVRRLEDEDSIIIKRHFKAFGMPKQVKASFDISTGFEHRYKVDVEDATEDDVDRAVPAPKERRKSESLDVYLRHLDTPCSTAQLIERSGRNKSSVSRALKKLQERGEVTKDEAGNWSRIELPDF